MKKRRGFTLVEMLAVIVILAVIALIAIPVTTGIIKKSKKAAFKQSAVGILKMTNIDRIDNGITNFIKYNIEDAAVQRDGAPEDEYVRNEGEIKGTGYAAYTSEGLSAINYTNGEWCATKAFNENTVRVIDGDCSEIEYLRCESPAIIIEPSNSVWSQYKMVTIDKNTNEFCKTYYSINGGEFQEYTESLRIEENNTVVTSKSINIENVEEQGTETITNIDNTAPTSISFVVETTTNSIEITVTAEDAESGISRYAFSKDGGETWTEYQTSKVYKFDNLTTGTYQIKTKVFNGTYGTPGITEELGMLESEVRNVTTDALGGCSIAIAHDGLWATSKEVTIEKTGTKNGTLQYKVENGETVKEDWQNYTSGYTIDYPSNTTTETAVYCRLTDGTNTTAAATKTETKVDSSIPDVVPTLTAVLKPGEKTKSIEVVVTGGNDSDSGIYGYQYSKDGGETWEPSTPKIGTDREKYTFENLKDGQEYKIKVRETNNTYGVNGVTEKNTTESAETIVTTEALGGCSIAITNDGVWSQSKVVSITKTGTENGILQYKVENGEETKVDWVNYESSYTVDYASIMTKQTVVYCRLTDEVNTTAAATKTETKVDPSEPDVAPTFTAEPTTNKTTRSITVTIIDGSDKESGIYGYQYSKDGGATWEPSTPTAEAIYEFDNLTNNKPHKIKVREINNTYGVNGQNENNTTESIGEGTTVTTEELGGCSIAIANDGVWAQSKVVSITKTGTKNGTLQYKVENGEETKVDWVNYESSYTIDYESTMAKQTVVYCRLTDEKNTTAAATKTETKVDVTEPDVAPTFTVSKTTKSIDVTVIGGNDSNSGIYGYQYSKDGGETWEPSTPKTGVNKDKHTFVNLKDNQEYKIKVREINDTYGVNGQNEKNTTESIGEGTSVTTEELGGCSISILPTGWSNNKTVTIEKTGTLNGKIEFQVLNGETVKEPWQDYEEAYTINYDSNLTKQTVVYCRLTDEVNTTAAATKTETLVETTAPSVVLEEATSTTRQVSVVATITDTESGISGTPTCKYSSEAGNYIMDGVVTKSGDKYTCEMNDLGHGTTYYYKICASDVAGNGPTCKTGEKETVLIPKPDIVISPSEEGWAIRKTATITYAEIAGVEKKYSKDGAALVGATANPQVVEFGTNGTIQATLTDGLNVVDRIEQVKYVDITSPSVTLGTSSALTSYISVEATIKDTESGIKGMPTCKYSATNGSYTENGTVSKNGDKYTCEMSGLTHKTPYYYEICATDNVDNEPTCMLGQKTTLELKEPEISISPSGWSTSKTATIIYQTTEGLTKTYNKNSSGWTPTTSTSQSVTFDANGTIEASITDGTNTKTTEQKPVTKIETTAPTVTLGSVTSTTKKVTVNATITDAGGSGLKTMTCKYGLSSGNYTNTVTMTNSGSTYTCEFDELTHGTTYYYQICATDEAGNGPICETGSKPTETIPTPTCSVTPASCSTSKTVTCDYGTLPSGVIKQYSTNGGSTWSEYSGALTYGASTTVIARATDGKNTLTSSSYSANPDTSGPSVGTISSSSNTKSITASTTITDGCGVGTVTCEYGTSTSYGSTGSMSSSGSTYTCTMSNLNHGTTYYYRICAYDGLGNGPTCRTGSRDTSTISVSCTSSSGCATSKTATCTFSPSSGLTKEYSIDGGSTWSTYPSSGVSFTSTGTIIGRATDGKNTVSSASHSITNIDRSGPSVSLGSASTTTKSISVSATISDVGCSSVGTKTCSYGTSTSYGSTGSMSGNTCTMSSLSPGITYYYKICASDALGNGPRCDYGSATTDSLSTTTPPTCSVPSGCAKSKTVTCSYGTPSSGVTKQYSKNGGSYSTYSSGIEFTSNGTIQPRLTDGTNTSTGSSYTVDNIDTSAPSVTLGTASTTKTSISVSATITDVGCSSVSSKTCEYGTSTSYGSTGSMSGNTCTMDSLTPGKTYYYRICATDALGNGPTCKTGSATTDQPASPTVTLKPPSSTTNSISVTATISPGDGTVSSKTCSYGTSTSYGSTGSMSGDTCTMSGLTHNKTYYYKICATNSYDKTTCKTGSFDTDKLDAPTCSVPSGYAKSKTVTCSFPSASTTNKYKKDSGSYTTYPSGGVSFTSNGTITPRASDGTNTVTGSSYTVDKIDTTSPTITFFIRGSSDSTATIMVTDNACPKSINGVFYINGTQNSTSNASTTATDCNTLYWDKGVQDGENQFRIAAVDQAGNNSSTCSTGSYPSNFTVTASESTSSGGIKYCVWKYKKNS